MEAPLEQLLLVWYKLKHMPASPSLLSCKLFPVVGATFFIASSLLFMFELQPAWWPPKPLLIGWHAGFWNMIGAVGFWLSGFFGLWAVPAAKYQLGGTVLSTVCGSYAFLIGSYLQLLEAVNRNTCRVA